MTAALLALLLLVPASASAATLPPHVTPTDTVAPDACAICHRAHTANSPIQYRTTLSIDPTGNALVLAAEPERGDVGLCYVCHGLAALGASVDVETSFSAVSTHALAPTPSAYGPSPKMCSSCHDSHGTAHTASGTPYPALLRSWEDTTTAVYSAEEYCVTCHDPRPASRFQTLAVYRQTGHYTGMPDPASGTKIRCSNCHASHGSSITPLIATTVYPPAAPATLTVAANDRRVCLACHPNAQATWGGEVAYTGSSHAASVKVVSALGEWPLPGATRRVGECQVCHAAMGKAGSGGDAIPKLGERAGRALCDVCHGAGGVAIAKLDAIAYPTAEAAQPELVGVFGADPRSGNDSRVSVWGRALTGADPRSLIGPREYRLPDATSTVASGDIDGDGQAELFVANASTNTLKLYQRDTLRGLSTTVPAWDVPVGIKPDFLLIGRFVGALAGASDQVAVVDATAGEMRVYEWDGSALQPVWPAVGAYSFGAGSLPSGLASGDVTGTDLPDLVVTDAGTDDLYILTQDGAASTDMTSTVATTQPGPRGPSVGDAWSRVGKHEIVVCNTQAATATVSVFDGNGAVLGEYTADGGASGAVPYASAIANVLSSAGGGGGREVCLALYDAAGTSCVNVFTQANPGPGLDPVPQRYDTGLMYGTASIAAGDVQGDGVIELVAGNGGRWAKASGMVEPSLQVFRSSDGSTLGVPDRLVAGGAEIAGSAPGIVIDDFGAVLPSRHPVEEYNATSHVSTETADFPRHVTCSDCHDTHQANDDPSTAPYITGRLFGSWGIPVTNNAPGVQPTFGGARMSTYQYETCFKCHSASIALAGRPDIASLVSTRNPSVHAIEAPSTEATARPATFVSGTDENSRVLYCTDCHGNAAGAAEATGTHRSTAAPMLYSALWGTTAEDAGLLCYRCHVRDVYYLGTGDDGSNGSRFYESSAIATAALHTWHVRSSADTPAGLGLACAACHVPHGSPTHPHLLRGDIGYTVTGADAGSCDNACHTAAHAYDGS